MSVEYKKYEIYSDNTFGMKLIKNSGSGTVPKILRGSFSNNNEAMRSIDRYLVVKKGKGNGKASSSG